MGIVLVPTISNTSVFLKMQNINKMMYYILYNNLVIFEEFFIKWYFKNNKLSENGKSEYMQMQFKRFGK